MNVLPTVYAIVKQGYKVFNGCGIEFAPEDL